MLAMIVGGLASPLTPRLIAEEVEGRLSPRLAPALSQNPPDAAEIERELTNPPGASESQNGTPALPPENGYLFVVDEERRTIASNQTLCRVPGVSRSGYYDYRDRSPSNREQQDEALAHQIIETHQRSRQTHGSPRVHAELRSIGVRCGRKRVARLMRERGIRGCRRGGRKSTTRRAKHAVAAEDLVDREFSATALDRSFMDCGHHIHRHVGGLFVSGLHPGRLLPQARWMGDGEPPAHRACHQCSGDGDLAPSADSRANTSQRPGSSIYGSVVRQETGGSRHRSFDGPGGIGAGQRHLGIVCVELEGRVGQPGGVSLAADSQDDSLRMLGEFL